MNLTDLILTGLGEAIVIIAGFFGIHKLNLKKVEQILQKDLPALKKVGEDIINVGKDALSIPEVATVETHLKLELGKVMNDFKNSELGHLALLGLSAFEKTTSQLTDTEKTSIALFIKSHLPSGIQVTAKEIEDAVNKALEDIEKAKAEPIISAAKTFVQAQQSVVQETDHKE